MQRAPEYRAITEQVYRLAAQKIAAPAPGSAALEQQDVPADALARMPTAVVLDLDETVLDNTVYQARLLRDRASYNAEELGRMGGRRRGRSGAGRARIHRRRAQARPHGVLPHQSRLHGAAAIGHGPVPGARPRPCSNLVALGHRSGAGSRAPAAAQASGRNGTPASRRTRRAFIAANYRIVALVGDDLGDFVDPQGVRRRSRTPRAALRRELVPAAESHLRSLDQSLRHARGEVRRPAAPTTRCSSCPAAVRGRTARPRCASPAGTSNT